MATLGIRLDLSGYTELIEETRTQDIPYASALALTRTAQDAQIEVKRGLRQKFTLRNTWTVDNIKITPARKQDYPSLYSEVYTDTGNGKAPDYLVGQEEGQHKVTHEGHTFLCIPTRFLRALIGQSTVIPAALRPAELLAAFTGTHVSRRSGKAVRTPKGQQYEGFKQYVNGELYILARQPGANRDAARPFYLLVPEANVRAALGMQETVERVVNDRFEQHWDDAWASITSQ